jgi:hypothetical protein
MSLFLYLIWIGGVFAYPDQKIGFFRRIFWPHEIGEKLAEWVLRK